MSNRNEIEEFDVGEGGGGGGDAAFVYVRVRKHKANETEYEPKWRNGKAAWKCTAYNVMLMHH